MKRDRSRSPDFLPWVRCSKNVSACVSEFFSFLYLVLDNPTDCDKFISFSSNIYEFSALTARPGRAAYRERDFRIWAAFHRMKWFDIFKHYVALMLSGMVTLLLIGLTLFLVSTGVIGLGYVLSYVFSILLPGETMEMFQFVLVALVVACVAGLGIPVFLLARNIQKSTESFSLMQFDEDGEDDGEFEEEQEEDPIDDAELNEFLKKLHKTRNIGPFIPSPKTMDDLCPCGSGLKYKDCCGKFWN